MDISPAGSSVPSGENNPRGSVSGPPSRPRMHARAKSSTEPGDALRQLQKQLTKYAHQTSSQFALIICDQKGNMQLPIPATSAFQGYLDNWIPDNVRQQARQIAISAAKEKKVRRRRDSGIAKENRHQQQRQREHDDEEVDWDEKELSPGERMLVQNSSGDGDIESHMKKRPSQSEDTATSRKKKSVPRPEPMRRASSAGTEDVSSELEFQPLIIGDEDAVTTFYMTRLRQMQQLMCKVVAKAWIKVIEPKKQTNFPYNRGNESKPAWWPEDVRHKEPDHLMKPERLQLLLTMLRCRKVPIIKLQMATQEVMVQIPKERVPLLDEIYMVAMKEESCREGALSPETAVYVASSAEKIIASKAASAAKEHSPDTRRQSIASPPNSGPGSTVGIADRRLSMQSPTHADLGGDGRGMDIRDLSSRVGSRDESGGVTGLQPTHNPFSGNNAPAANLNTTIEYTNGYVAHSSPLQGSPMQEQPSFLPTEPLGMRTFFTMEQAPIMRKNYTMPTIPQPSAHPWPNTQMGMYPTYSPGATPSHTPYSRQSASNPATPVGNGSFQGLQLPPPHQNREPPPPTHYDQPQHMNGGHQNITSGFTEFLRSDLATEDGGRGVKME